jgi:hypothetical protein
VHELSARPIVHVCIRQTLDWRDPALVEARILPAFRPKLRAWNATFTLPYHAFRQRVRVIAEQNLGRVEGAVHTRLEDVPAGDLIVPIDDDDWLAPGLVTQLRWAHDAAATGYLWTRAALEHVPRWVKIRRRLAVMAGRRERFVCKTNNYALVNEPRLASLALDHVEASGYFEAHPSSIRRIPATLAVQNRSLGSQTTLAWGRPTIAPGELVALLRRHRALYASWTPPAGLEWAAPCVAAMRELMCEIEIRAPAARS